MPCHPGAGYRGHWPTDQRGLLQGGVAARYVRPDARRGSGYLVVRFPYGGVIRCYVQADQQQSALVLCHQALHQQTVNYPVWQSLILHSLIWHGLTGSDLLLVAVRAGAHLHPGLPLPGAGDHYQRGFRPPDVHAGCHHDDDYADAWVQRDQQKGGH